MNAPLLLGTLFLFKDPALRLPKLELMLVNGHSLLSVMEDPRTCPCTMTMLLLIDFLVVIFYLYKMVKQAL